MLPCTTHKITVRIDINEPLKFLTGFSIITHTEITQSQFKLSRIIFIGIWKSGEYNELNIPNKTKKGQIDIKSFGPIPTRGNFSLDDSLDVVFIFYFKNFLDNLLYYNKYRNVKY